MISRAVKSFYRTKLEINRFIDISYDKNDIYKINVYYDADYQNLWREHYYQNNSLTKSIYFNRRGKTMIEFGGEGIEKGIL